MSSGSPCLFGAFVDLICVYSPCSIGTSRYLIREKQALATAEMFLDTGDDGAKIARILDEVQTIRLDDQNG